MASLKLSFTDVYTDVGKYLGIPSLSNANDIAKCKRIVYRGYRKFLMPLDPSTGKIHKWKFLEKTTTLSIVADTDTYKLPIGFSSFVTPFTYTSAVTVNPQQRTLTFIYEHKAQTSTSGPPMYFALKDGDYDEINGQQYYVVFWPTPAAAATFYYTYVLTPPAPVNDDDVFVGDALTSEAIMECALAVAELQENGSLGVHNQEADRIVSQLIGKDKSDSLVPYLGQITNGKSISHTPNAVITDSDGNVVISA